LQSLAPTIPASFLTFGSKPLYPIYMTFPRIWGVSAINDQQIAGLIMKLVGGLILWIMVGVVFFHWYERERTEGWDDLKWHDVDREIQAGVSR
jgi:putative membrane protein